MRRVGYVIAALAAAATLGGASALIAVHVTHPRDERAYLNYLQTYGQVGDAGVGTVPASDLLVAEGDRSCDWLGGQPWALWRTDTRFRILIVESRYTDETKAVPLAWSGQPDHATIAAAAWNYLCPAALELREPHDVFGTKD